MWAICWICWSGCWGDAMNAYTVSDLREGLEESFSTTVTAEMMQKFCDITGDVSPIHVDEAYAKARGHAGRVVYGMLCAGLFSTLAGVYLPGETCLLHSVDVKFAKPVYIGDTLTVRGRVGEVSEAFRQITVKVDITNQHGQKVTRGSYKAGVAE